MIEPGRQVGDGGSEPVAAPVGVALADPAAPPRRRTGWLAFIVGKLGAQFIYALIWLFGRTHRRADVPWLAGPIGERVIGDAPYRQVALAEDLTVERMARDGGLVPSFAQLDGGDFVPGDIHPRVREFYEHTTEFAMDVWSKTYFPSNVGLWLLVTTISRQVEQLNFPLSPLATARGMSSEVISMRRRDGSVRYTGWFRTVGAERAVLYTGFYMTERAPNEAGPCVKVVFPMPNGNATVLLRPQVSAGGALVLDSSGKRFGDAGFYRIQARGADRIRVWHIRSLKEHFRVFVDDAGVLRCDHTVRFLGLPVLTLHYKIVRRDR
ncbi:MAG: hypothetical protein M3680_33850 [Myxococcota bacterium]|nr:hypothetical protein [Myxococcota bacterium]